MSLTGNAKGKTLRGNIKALRTIRGYSAYEIAVINGFSGTEEEWLTYLSAYGVACKNGFHGTEQEWLASLKGGTSSGSGTATIGMVDLLAAKWVGEGNLYSQVVPVYGATPNSQVDLTPSVEQLAIFHDKDLALVAENEDGVVTVYAIGQKPTNDYTIQVTITEVAV